MSFSLKLEIPVESLVNMSSNVKRHIDVWDLVFNFVLWITPYNTTAFQGVHNMI